MIVNDSSTGGYLVPSASPAPLEDKALFEFVQQFLVNVLNGPTTPPLIPGNLFFPRWQLEPPNYPGPTIDWAAFGIESTPAQEFPEIRHFGGTSTTPGYDEYHMHEWVEVLVSFYGPNCNRNARLVRDGMYIPQNRAVLLANDFNFTGTAKIVTAPSLVKERWLYKVDFRATLRRRIVRQYPILDLEAADITVNNEFYTFPIYVGRSGAIEIVENSDPVVSNASVISSGVVQDQESSDNVAALGA